MAKFTRNQLKGLVKECLLEILSEGLSSSPDSLSESLMTSRPKMKTAPARPMPSRDFAKLGTARNPALDSISYGNSSPVPENRIHESIQNSVSQITSDPIMSDIFADTAATTLQEQIAEESRSSRGSGAVDTTEKIGDPGEIFSQSAQNWALLAFSDGPKNR